MNAASGLVLAAALAFMAKALAEALSEGLAGLPKLPISPVLCAVLIGMLWRNAMGLPRWAEDGLKVSMTTVLRAGVALVGLKLTLSGAEAIAATALPVVIVCIVGALLAAFVISKAFGISPRLGALLGVGTAVCGCTAVIAMSPVIRARNAETAFAITCVVFFGCIAMLCYPLVAALLFHSSPLHAGVFLGTAIHDTSQVIGSALIYSQQMHAPDALVAASLTKLLRNLSIAILIPLGAWWAQRLDQEAGSQPAEGTPRVRLIPFFVIAFMALIVLRTVGDFTLSPDFWNPLVSAAQTLSELFLTCGMAAVGLSISLSQMWSIGWRPLIAGMLIALFVGVCSLTLTLSLARFS